MPNVVFSADELTTLAAFAAQVNSSLYPAPGDVEAAARIPNTHFTRLKSIIDKLEAGIEASTDALAVRAANTIYAGPSTGPDAAALFRSLVAADIPTLTSAKISDFATAAAAAAPVQSVAGRGGAVVLVIADVAGLQTALDGKSATGHGHSIGDVTGLQTALDGKSAVGHTHAAGDVTSGVFPVARGGTGLSTIASGKLLYASALDTYAALTLGAAFAIDTGTLNLADLSATYQAVSAKGQANGYAGLGAGALVPVAQLGSGTANSTTFLRGDGSWQTPAGGSIDGTGTGGKLTKWSDTDTLTDSLLSESGGNIVLASGQFLGPTSASHSAPTFASSAQPDSGITIGATGTTALVANGYPMLEGNGTQYFYLSPTSGANIAFYGDYAALGGVAVGAFAPDSSAVILGSPSGLSRFRHLYLGGTVTSDAPALDIAQTWNNGAATFTAAKVNVTDTTSAAASKLLDLQVGGVSKFSVTKSGATTISDGLALEGAVQGFNVKTLTDDTPTDFVRVACDTTDSSVGGEIVYTVEAISPTGHVVHAKSGRLRFQCANANGAVTASVSEAYTPEPQLTDAGTLALTWSTNVSGTNVNFRVQANTSLDAAATTFRIRYRPDMPGVTTVTPL